MRGLFKKALDAVVGSMKLKQDKQRIPFRFDGHTRHDGMYSCLINNNLNKADAEARDAEFYKQLVERVVEMP